MHIAIKLQIIRWYLFISLCTSGGNFCVQSTQCTQIATYLLTFPRSLALVVSIRYVEILTMSRVISPNVFTCRHKFSHEDPIEAVDGQPH